MKLCYLLCSAALCVGAPILMADEPLPVPVPGAAAATQVIQAPNVPDGFTIANGRVYFIRDGQMVPLKEEVVLRVSPNGTITAFDGKTYIIPSGQVLTLSAGVVALSAAGQPAVIAAPSGGTAVVTNPQAPQAPGPTLSTSPFTRFHAPVPPQVKNPQLTYPVPNDSPFTRFHQQPVPQEIGQGGAKDIPSGSNKDIPNNAPTGTYK